MNDLLREKIEIISLVVAALVVIIGLYRYMLMRWRSDVNLRTYPFLKVPSGRFLEHDTTVVQVDCPSSQTIELALLDEKEEMVIAIHTGQIDAGLHSFEVQSEKFTAGVYYLRLKSNGQVDTRRIDKK